MSFRNILEWLGWSASTGCEVLSSHAERDAPRRHATEARIKRRWAEVEVLLRLERGATPPVLAFKRKP